MMGLTRNQQEQITQFEVDNILKLSGEIETCNVFRYTWGEVNLKYNVKYKFTDNEYITKSFSVNIDPDGKTEFKFSQPHIYSSITPKASVLHAQTSSPEFTGNQ